MKTGNAIKSKIKSLVWPIGLYPIAHNFYSRVSPEHRQRRFVNREFYRGIVNQNDLCFDIGANVGQTSEAFIEVGGVVVAVEPNPLCQPVLNHKFKKNSKVTVVNKAVGSATGFAELNFNGTNTTASIRKDWYSQTNKEKKRVEVVTLDNLITQYGYPKFLKVDVEGFELEVFKGLTRPIELIYFEMHDYEVEIAWQVLERLGTIGEIFGVKVISGDNSTWLIEHWVSPSQLIEKLRQSLPTHANIIVKMKTSC